jgi:hypothetical protein
MKRIQMWKPLGKIGRMMGVIGRNSKTGRCSFLKKRTKKLLLPFGPV